MDVAYLLSSRWRTAACQCSSYLLNDFEILLSCFLSLYVFSFSSKSFHDVKTDNFPHTISECVSSTLNKIFWRTNLNQSTTLVLIFLSFQAFLNKCGSNCMKHKPEATVSVSALLSSGLLMFSTCLISRQQ